MKNNFKPIKGPNSKRMKSLHQCKKIFSSFSNVIDSIAITMKSSSIKKVVMNFSNDKDSFSLKFINSIKSKGSLLIEIENGEYDNMGTPYYSNWEGVFYRSAEFSAKPYVNDGEEVKKGQPLGVVVIDKNNKFILNSPESGFVSFPEKYSNFKEGKNIFPYLEDSGKKNCPLFYLK